MKKFETINELAKYTFNNNLSVLWRKENIVTFNNWLECIVTFDSEFFK